MADGNGADLPITGVTVFRDGARVARAGSVQVRAGLHPVSLGTLPASADPDSIRVAVAGDSAALLEVEVRRGVRADPLREEVTRLRNLVEEAQDALSALEDEESAANAGLGFIGHLSEASATALARAVGAGRADYEELSKMAGHLSASTEHALARRREIAGRKRAAHRELEAAKKRLAGTEQWAKRPEEYAEVIATIEADAAGTADVEISYHTSGASWKPLYDLTLTGERVAVSYLAEVTQRTGEDWPETTLVLSTARRGAHRTLPELEPWYIDRARQPVFGLRRGPVRAQRAAALSAAGEEPIAGAAPGAAPGAAEPGGEIPAEAERLGADADAGVVYTVARPLAVPADGAPHKTLIIRFDADTELDYLTIPALAPEAYLRATIQNGSSLLLPGPARIFRGSQFAGATELETVAPGEEFEVQLGVDDEVRVERKLRRRATGKSVIGGTRTIDIAYEITVENHRDRAARISVRDHIPLSRDGEIKVRLRETNPSPGSTDDLGELTWPLSLDPGEKAAITYRFTVEHPATLTVTGL